jgi:hypothetical protein
MKFLIIQFIKPPATSFVYQNVGRLTNVVGLQIIFTFLVTVFSALLKPGLLTRSSVLIIFRPGLLYFGDCSNFHTTRGGGALIAVPN